MPRKSRHSDYRSFLYNNFPYEETHPGRLAMLAMLHGIDPPPPTRCRVLELGCGLGGNIIGLASAMPDCQFVGVDLSPEQIAAAKADVEALGLTNVELHALNILDVDRRLGRFDYILCHGIFSWVPEEVRAKILRICRSQLHPSGVAYISYNCYPGWHVRGMLRDILVRETGSKGSATERVQRARDLLTFLDYVPQDSYPVQAALRSELDVLRTLGDEYLFYEHLVNINQPQYFSEFVGDAARAGLGYLTDAHYYSVYPGRLGPDAALAVEQRSEDFLEREQLMDYLEVRYFRRALLIHKEVPVDRRLHAGRLARLYVQSELRPAPLPEGEVPPALTSDAEVHYQLASGRGVSVHLPVLKAALQVLHEEYPQALLFPELVQRARALVGGETEGDSQLLGDNVLDLFVLGYAELSAWKPPCARVAGPRPRTTPLVRLQVRERREGCTNLLQQSIGTDNLDRSLLSRMDGNHDHAALVDGVADDVKAGKLRITIEEGEPYEDERELYQDLMQQKLVHLARSGLLLP